MDSLITWLTNNEKIVYTFLSLLVFLIIVVAIIYIVAFIEGRKISFYPPSIGEKPKVKLVNVNNVEADTSNSSIVTHRILLYCSTTYEIEKSPRKIEALKLFYRCLITEIERSHYSVNFCGAEPMKTVLWEYYSEKLRIYNKDQIRKLDQLVRWYWCDAENVALNYAPAYFESHQSNSPSQRIA